MTEYAHNHPPHCCCPTFLAGTRTPAEVCPLCPEHGELAQLGNTANAEYPCCHQLVGRPHTDYCPTACGITPEMQQLAERMIADEAANDPWRAHLAGIEVRNPLGMTHEPTHHTHTSDPNGPHERSQCHPDRCGMWATPVRRTPYHDQHATDPNHACNPRCDWPTQTTQPASQTSTPTTQVRQRYCGHSGGHQPHPNADATVCGGYPPSTADEAREPTPLATPTPPRCPNCDSTRYDGYCLSCGYRTRSGLAPQA